MELIGKTSVGNVRSNNEDVFAFDQKNGYCLVADGMGGAAAGEIASRIFANVTQKVFASGVDDTMRMKTGLVQDIFKRANDRILEHTQNHPAHKGMGCTAELLVWTGNDFVLGHVGDSRTYRLRGGRIMQLTKDHSLVQEQIDDGLITKAEARSHSMRNVILQAVGVKAQVAIDILRGKILDDDLFLLCSDGLTDMVEDHVINHILWSNLSLSMKAEKLIKEANDAGGRDNITIVLAKK